MQALASRGSLRGGRRGAPPGVGGGGVPESFAASGAAPEVQGVWGECPSAEAEAQRISAGPGRAGRHGSGPGPAKVGRAPQPFLRPPRSPSSQRPEPAGPAPSRATAAAEAVTCRPRRPGSPRGGAPAGLVPAQSRSQPLAPKFQPQKQFPEGADSGGEAVAELACQRRCESAPTLPGRDSPRLGYRDTSTTLLRHGADAGQREQALLSPLGRGLPGLAGAEGCPSRGPEPGAVRDQPRQGGCSCARECGLPPRQLAGVLSAAAPDGPLPPPQAEPPPPPPSLRSTRAHTRPDASAAAAAAPLSLRQRPRPRLPPGHALGPRPLRAPRGPPPPRRRSQANGLASVGSERGA
ncbi:basic proline-rich protein-like [Mustela lutreola]|uniref:basic proline-rich protein-like n=1 Tax=Mustela lutreola TaxID=9666 RepID=UPI00279713B5|nr:basic proline-rich protein-like [Mustela lutreola]